MPAGWDSKPLLQEALCHHVELEFLGIAAGTLGIAREGGRALTKYFGFFLLVGSLSGLVTDSLKLLLLILD